MLLVLALFSAVAVLFVSGCGSDDGSTTASGAGDTTAAAGAEETTGETDDEGGDEGGDDTTEAGGSLTKAEYVKQGNEACARIQKAVGERFEAYVKEQNVEEVTPTEAESRKIVAKFAIPAMKEQVEALQAIPAPEGDEKKVELILDRQEESLKKMEEEPLFRTSGAPYEELNKPASDYGLTECSV
jgi:hypothetical protein